MSKEIIIEIQINLFFLTISCTSFEGAGDADTVPVDNHELPNNQQADREESEISQLFAISRHQLNRCMKCNKEVRYYYSLL